MVNTQANILSNFWKEFRSFFFLIFFFSCFVLTKEGRSFKIERSNHIICEKLCQSCRKDKGFRLLVAGEAEFVIAVCNNYSLGTLGERYKRKGGKEDGRAGGVSQCTWERHRWGRQPHFPHLILSSAVTALALSAVRDALNDDLFVLSIFSIRFKTLHSVIYCQVSSLCSGNCHFKEK